MSELGGAAGLVLGVSLISIVRVVDSSISLFYLWAAKRIMASRQLKDLHKITQTADIPSKDTETTSVEPYSRDMYLQNNIFRFSR